MLAQLRGMGDGDWLVGAWVHMQGRRSQGIIGESPMSAWQIVGDSGVGVAVVVVVAERGGGGKSWEDDGVDGQEMEVGNGRVEL
jgi:hypothetical protein